MYAVELIFFTMEIFIEITIKYFSRTGAKGTKKVEVIHAAHQILLLQVGNYMIQ